MYDTTRNSDDEVRTAVLQKLKASVPGIPELSIRADEGVITLKGQFKDNSQVFEADSEAWGVPGVRAVIEASIGDTPSTLMVQRTLAKAVLSELLKCSDDTSLVRVTVHKGYVILDGLVRYHRERERIGRCVRNVPGVLGICNRINLGAVVSHCGSSMNCNARADRNGSPGHRGPGGCGSPASDLVGANHG